VKRNLLVSTVLGLLLGMAGCTKAPVRPVEKLALLPFENLTGDATLDWISSAAPAVLSNQLTGLPKVVIYTGAAVRDAYIQGATRVLHGYFSIRGGKPHFEASLEDLETRKIVQHYSNDAAVLPALDALAHTLDGGAKPFPVEDPLAVEGWIKALKTQSGYEEAAARAPDFGLLYVTWAESLSLKNDREGALRVISQALARPTLKGAIDRARLELIKAELEGNVGARAEAFDKVAKLSPNDLAAVRGAAENNFRAHRYAAAIEGYRAALVLEPENFALLNQIGYSQALNGDLAAGKATLEDYSKKPEQGANGADSLGEIHFYHGKFAEAEKYFLLSHEKNPTQTGGYDLYKAALAHWLSGDVAGADAIHQKYIDYLTKQVTGAPTVGPRELMQARSERTTGRADAAKRRLQDRPEYAALLVLWNGDAAKLPPSFALLFAKRFAEATELWKRAYEQSGPSTDALPRTMYAWCLSETGHKAEAKELLKYYAMPQQADGIFATLVYPRFLELRK